MKIKVEWNKFSEILPDDNKLFLTVDKDYNYYIRSVNSIHKLPDNPGIFTPAKNGEGAELIYWMYLPGIPIE